MTESSAEKILLVEDSRSFAALLKTMLLKTNGFDVEIAATRAATQVLLEGQRDEFFVAIVDYHLPDSPEGEAIADTVSAGIPTVVFTGTTERSTEQNLWLKGIADYANKSDTFNLEYVCWVVKRIHQNRHVEVLIADSSVDERNATAGLLARQNFIVHTAGTGVEAIETLKINPDIRLAIIDSDLQDMNALGVTSVIRENHPRAKLEIIGVSEKQDQPLSARFIKAGASDFIVKPLVPEEFLCRVNNAVDRIEAYFELDRLNLLKNQFLGAAAHDIRGPLGSIKTAADFLLKRSSSEERREKLLNMIRNSSHDLLELLETLLDISVIESGNPKMNIEVVNASQSLKDHIELYQSEAASKDIELETDIEEDIRADLDLVKTKQIFDNLITNALKFSPNNSIIRVRLANSADHLLLSVQDSGPGITDEEQKQLFKAFTVLSTKATGGEKKTGLGLAITKSIVEAHRGKIYYRNTPECHSTFFVELPLSA